MKKILMTLLFLLIASNAHALVCGTGGGCWEVAGGTGNWSSTTNWANSSGGVTGLGPPSATDAVFLDAASGNITVDTGAAVAASVSMTGGTGNYTGTMTFTAGQTLTSAGSVTFSSGATLAGTGTLAINNTATITPAGLTFPGAVTLSGTSKTFTLAGPWTVTGNLTLNGTTGLTFATGGNNLIVSAMIRGTSTAINTFTGAGTVTMANLQNALAGVFSIVTSSLWTVTSTISGTSNGGTGWTITGTGNMTAANLDLHVLGTGTGSFSFTSGKTLTITNSIYINGSPNGLYTVKSGTASSSFTLTYTGTLANEIISSCIFTDVDASTSSVPIYNWYGSTLTRTTNVTNITSSNIGAGFFLQ